MVHHHFLAVVGRVPYLLANCPCKNFIALNDKENQKRYKVCSKGHPDFSLGVCLLQIHFMVTANNN